MSDKNQNILSKLKFNDRWSTSIIGTCCIVLIVAFGVCVVNRNLRNPENKYVKIMLVETDSLSIAQCIEDKTSFLLTKSSLDSIINHLEAHEAVLEQKYQYILQKREEEDNYRDIFMLVFGIVVSVAGFFGFRSFANVADASLGVAKEQAEKIAREEMPGIAENMAQKTSEKYCSENVDMLVRKYLDEKLSTLVNAKVEDLYNNENRAAMIQEITSGIDVQIIQYFRSEDGRSLVGEIIDSIVEDAKKEEINIQAIERDNAALSGVDVDQSRAVSLGKQGDDATVEEDKVIEL